MVAAGCAPGDPGADLRLEPADPQAPTGGRNAQRWLDAPIVVLVSLDGFAADYVERFAPPTLTALARRGVWAPEGMIPAFPTKTFPNHYSLATGLHPARHGIVANTFYDPDRNETYRISDREKVEDGTWYGGEPLWVTAERQGMVAASYFWVGSEADVGGVRPSHWRVYDHEGPKADRVDKVLEWLAYPPEARPHLVTLYFADTDDAGHHFGPGSDELRDAVAEVDAALGRLVAGIERLEHGDEITILVVSDHGMDGYTPETIEYLADVLGSLDGIRVPEAGPSANLWVDGGPERARAVRDALDAGLRHARAYLADETPDRLRYRGHPRIGDVVVVADSGWMVYPENDRPRRAGFTHGWDNAVLSMRALFVGAGPRLSGGRRIDPFSNVDVYPLVTELLGLVPAPGIDGSAETWADVLSR